MAKILPGLAVHKISGTIAGTTFQNWRGILVARKKPTPTNVNTPRQSFVRAIMTTLSRVWRDELNQGLRTAWNQRAKTYPWLDVFGNEVKMSGENLYIKQNMVLLDHGLTRQDNPVPDVVPPDLTDLTFVSQIQALAVTVPNMDPAIVTAQAPFLDVSLAGGFTLIENESSPLGIELIINSQLLPAGRVHQKSDFRHCAYVDDVPVAEPPVIGNIEVDTATISDRNCVLSIRRYNKYGNFTSPIVIQAIVPGA